MADILSLEQIRHTENLNIEAINFYLDLAYQRLKDTIDIKKELEYKGNALFAGYATAALALFGFAEKFNTSAFWFNLTAIILCIAIVPLFFSFKSSDYGVIGRHPKNWLGTKDYIAVKSEKMPLIYAYELRALVPKIEKSSASNKAKARFLNVAILLGICSLLPFFIKALFSL